MPCRAALLCIWCLLLASGCQQQPSVTWSLTLNVATDGSAVLDCDRFRLSFEQFIPAATRGYRLSESRMSLMVSGPNLNGKSTGSNRGASRSNEYFMNSDYADGTGTITMNEFVIKSLNSGKKLSVCGKVFTLGPTKLDIKVHKDGKVELIGSPSPPSGQR